MPTQSFSLFATPQWIQAEEGATPRLPRFTMLAYSGGPMTVGGWKYPVVIDCDGLDIPSPKRPIRLQHDSMQGVGHTESVRVEQGQLFADGVVSRSTPAAMDVVSSGMNGFPWQASVGVSVSEHEFIKPGVKVQVNGRELDGPVNVVRKGSLGEISFVDCPADRNTSATISAKQSNMSDGSDTERNPMGLTVATMAALIKAHQEDTGLIVAGAEAGDDEATINQAIDAAVRAREVATLVQAKADLSAALASVAELTDKLAKVTKEKDELAAKFEALSLLKASAPNVAPDATDSTKGLRRSQMSLAEKSAFQRQHGSEAYWKLPE